MGWLFGLIFLIPLAIFIAIMLPIIFWMSFRRPSGSSNILSEKEHNRLQELTIESQRMRDRIHVLESILDDAYPNWRER